MRNRLQSNQQTEFFVLSIFTALPEIITDLQDHQGSNFLVRKRSMPIRTTVYFRFREEDKVLIAKYNFYNTSPNPNPIPNSNQNPN